jgi:hypothetical protein
VKVSVKVPWFTFLFAYSVTVDATAVPCKLSVDGETEHVELAGAPLQERAIVPVRPLIGVKVML